MPQLDLFAAQPLEQLHVVIARHAERASRLDHRLDEPQGVQVARTSVR